MNAELQGTLGPLLKARADAAGVVLTDSDGDQPGVIMNLLRFVEGIGVRPALVRNIKGLHDAYRNPTTQEGFARRRGLSANMATSFADGTKISFEMAIVANATGIGVGTPLGPPVVEVITAAKRDLEAGEVLDGIGFYMTYGLVENAGVAAAEGLLPMGLAEGCRLERDVAKDEVIAYADVAVPPGRLADRLRAEQDARFASATPGEAP